MIFDYWRPQLIAAGKINGDYEFNPGLCFACGWTYEQNSERAHIVARTNEGDNTADNLHLLCFTCHKDSEYVEGEAYLDWFKRRTFQDKVASAMIRAGVSFSDVVLLSRGEMPPGFLDRIPGPIERALDNACPDTMAELRLIA